MANNMFILKTLCKERRKHYLQEYVYIFLTFANINNAGNTWFKKFKRRLYT